jgi:hypothetical protein
VGELGGLGAAVAAVACLLAISPQGRLLPSLFTRRPGGRRLAWLSATAFAALAVAFFRARHGGPQSGPLVLTALITAASALVLVTAVAPRAARAIALGALGAVLVAAAGGGLRGV